MGTLGVSFLGKPQVLWVRWVLQVFCKTSVFIKGRATHEAKRGFLVGLGLSEIPDNRLTQFKPKES